MGKESCAFQIPGKSYLRKACDVHGKIFFSFFFIVGRVLFVSVTGTYKVKACRKLPEHKSHGFRSCPGAETMSEIRGRGLGNTKVERERENARSEY